MDDAALDRTKTARRAVHRALDSARSGCYGSRLVPSFVPRRSPVKRTYQPHNKRRSRTHGFRQRMKSRGGRRVLAARRRKGRHNLAVTVATK